MADLVREDELMTRAWLNYARRCSAIGAQAEIPSRNGSGLEWIGRREFAVMRNNRGIIEVSEVLKSGRLRYVERANWPKRLW
jgi:hypothetical protein